MGFRCKKRFYTASIRLLYRGVIGEFRAKRGVKCLGFRRLL